MSVIIISAILLVVIVGGSLTGWNSRFDILDAESKERSSALADACVGSILLQLATNGAVVSGPVSVGSDQCRILNTASPYQIQASFNNAYTNLQVAVDPDTLTIISWQEVSVF